ncbi:MAG: DJ-1/PfpI family protein, partial [Bacteroidota bacterium]
LGLDGNSIRSQGVVTIQPDYTIDNCPRADIVVFVGGNGSNSAANPKVQAWIKKIAPQTKQFFTVCTGAFFLAEAGLLKGQTVTTFHHAIDDLRKKCPDATVLDDVRYVDNGRIVTTAGISAGIDGALHLVHRMLGKELADAVAVELEYDYWQADRGLLLH